MAVNIKPKQALGFLPERNCICNSPYCQPILTTDSFMIQGTVDNLTNNQQNLANNSDPMSLANWTLDAGFTITSGVLHGVNVVPGNAAQTISPIGFVAGRLYLIQIDVDVVSAGTATAGQGWIVAANGDYLQLPDSIPLSDGYNQSLTASWLYSPSAITTDNILFTTDNATIDFDVNYVRVYEISQVGLALYSGATLVDTVTPLSNPSFLKYYFNGALFMNNGSLVGGVTNIILESVTNVSVMWEMYIDAWEDVTSETGCLTARFYDTMLLTNRVRNGTFTGGLDHWIVGDMWGAGAFSNACFTLTGGTPGNLSQTIYLEGGRTYTLSFSLSGISGSNTMQAQYLYGGDTETVEYNSNGTQTYEVDLTALTGIQTLTIVFMYGGSSPEETFCIDSVTTLTEDIDDFNVSNCINIQSEHPCTLLLYAINLDNAFGLDYTSGSLQHWLRVYGKIKYSGYPDEADIFRFSDNSNSILWAIAEKEFEVIIGDAPEAIHDCLQILRLHDIFQIDGSSYIKSGNYDLNRRRSSDNSQAVFTVKEQQGVSSNYNCT